MTAARTVAVVALVLTAACGGSSTTPSVVPGSVTIATGPHVLRLTQTGFTCSINGVSINPLVYTRVTVSQVGSEWVVSAATSDAGDVEMRFRQSGTALIAGSMPIDGTIRGQAAHLADLAAGLPPWNSRLAFGTDGRTTITGVAVGTSSGPPNTSLNGTGSGTVTLSDSTGSSCGGSSFSWTLGPGA